MAPLLRAAGQEVVGIDAHLYAGCAFGDAERRTPPSDERLDVRDLKVEDLEGFDAIVHLAALSNDPLGDLNADLTRQVNCEASVALARKARESGVERFLFASSCSLYGVAEAGALLDESANFNPITPYGRSKVSAERGISELATEDFSPTYMRNATVYGISPRLRADVVVNNLVALAHTTGEVLLRSDGTAWRPLVHVGDVCRAFLAVLEASREDVHDVAFNVGRTEENYRIREVAEIVAGAVPDTRVAFSEDAAPDRRSYRVDCSRLLETLPAYSPRWTVPAGVRQLRDAFEEHGLQREEFEERYVRLRWLNRLRERGMLDEQLRWTEEAHEHGEGRPRAVTRQAG